MDGCDFVAVVTLDKALMWVDSRYFIQAEKQLSDAWTLMKIGTKDTPRVKAGCKHGSLWIGLAC